MTTPDEAAQALRDMFLAVDKARDAFADLIRATRGLSDLQRFAIACGNEPYADDKVCQTCGGKGYV